MPSTVERTTLSVKDFGPIARAEIDLRPFTVFVGASNTGKSYLAILLYALHQFFGKQVDPFAALYHPNRLRHSPSAGERMASEQAEAIGHWLQQTEDELAGSREWDGMLPDQIAAFVRPLLQDVGDVAPLLDAEVKRCFGLAQSADLIRHPAGECARVMLRREFGDATSGIGYDVGVSRERAQLSSSIPANMPLRIPEASLRDLRWLAQRTRQQRRLPHPGEVADLIVPSTAGAVARPAHYLPADRAGVIHAHRIVVSSLLGSASLAGLAAESLLPTLSGVLADFLRRLINLPDERRGTGSKLADLLEADILGGSVRVRWSAIGYPSFHYRPATWQREIALMNTSSMVSELTPVVLYLRHIVRKGHLIIIEEPESHLHPQMQVAFTRFLALVVKAGIRVIVTTHSEWVLEALANLVRLSEVAKSRRSKIDAKGPALTPDEVGAWLFERKLRPQGSVVKEIPLDTVRGTFPAGFGDITENLYNDWAEVTNLIQDRA